MDILIREATVADAAQLLEIYAPYVEQTAITFEYDVPSLPEFQDRIRETGRSFPYLVATRGDRIVGYAYAHSFYGRAAYRRSVETSIYLDREERRHGVGRRLYAALERQLRERGFLNMNACIAYQDEPDAHLPLDSVRFHEAMGFVRCAHFHKCGYKFGRWYDVVWAEKMIGPHEPSSK